MWFGWLGSMYVCMVSFCVYGSPRATTKIPTDNINNPHIKQPQRVEGGMEDDRVEFTLPLESDPQYQLIVSSNRLVQGACFVCVCVCVCVCVYIYVHVYMFMDACLWATRPPL